MPRRSREASAVARGSVTSLPGCADVRPAGSTPGTRTRSVTRVAHVQFLRMAIDLDPMLRAYAELTVKVGLNLQPHQRLLVIGPVANGGCSLEAAPLVRQITAAAYEAG